MPRRARRPAGAVPLAPALLATLVLTSCGGAGEPQPYDATGVDGLEIPTPSPDPADFVDEVDNPWFPLPAGDTRTYVVEQDGRRLGEVDVEVARQETVAGVETTVVVTRVRGKGGPSPATRYYAQDEAGNVWLLGEDSAAADWRAGRSGAQAGLAMPAEPRVGDGWLRALVPGGGGDVVQATEPLATEPDGVTGPTVWLLEEDGDGTLTRAVYESGVGLVESVEEDTGRTTTLVR